MLAQRMVEPRYWDKAVKRAWSDFAFHYRWLSMILSAVGIAAGAVVGKGLGAVWGAIAGIAVPAVLFLYFLLIRTPRKLWEEDQATLTPKVGVFYIRDDALFTEDGQTQRLRVMSTGPTTIDDVRLRITDIRPASFSGILPFRLRTQHGDESTLYGDAPLLFDLLEYPYGGNLDEDGNEQIFLCHAINGIGELALLHSNDAGGKEYEIDVEGSGRNVPTVTARFRALCVATTHEPGVTHQGTVRITPIA